MFLNWFLNPLLTSFPDVLFFPLYYYIDITEDSEPIAKGMDDI